MAISRKKAKLRQRRGDVTLLVVSLLLAVFIWLVHNLTQDYFSYRQFNVTAISNLDGYAQESSSPVLISVGGQAKGYDLISRRRSRRPEDIHVRLDADLFTPDPRQKNVFTVNGEDIHKFLDDAIGGDFSVTVVAEEKIAFTFSPQSCRKVPVLVPETSISFAPQYMKTAELSITPDSVLVYGNVSDLEKVTLVSARPIRLQGLDRDTQGEVALNRIPGVRLGSRSIQYFVPVDRFVEETVNVDLKVSDVPLGKKVLLLPSSVKVICRLPFSEKKRLTGDDLSFTLRYSDLTSSITSKVIPKMTSSTCKVYSYETEPKMVDFIISEDR